MGRSPKPLLLAGVALLTLACAKESPQNAPPAQQTAAVDTARAADSAGTAGMPGMGGMAGMSGAQMGQMMAQMKSMQGMHGDSLMKMMPMHRQMAESMLGQMEKEMQAANKAADAKWKALDDSVHADLTRMSSMSAAEMEKGMAAVHARMTRLMDMYKTATGATEQPK